jgi:histidinol dehydrogenase
MISITKSIDLKEEFFEKYRPEQIDSIIKIIDDIKINGDKAVKKYTRIFDNMEIDSFELTPEDIKKAYEKVDKKTIATLKKAGESIKFFAEKQMELFKDIEVEHDNVILGHRIIPIENVGCYVPGGLYALPSCALMSVIPAKVAGVDTAIVCSPKIAPATVVAADLAGADRIFNLGGVQAIAAMAYGTETIPRVDKIVGPGNKYVAAAKKELYGIVGIDMIAGPSEVLVIADETGKADIIAADMLAQGEHDPNAKAFLVTTSDKLAKEVQKELERQLPLLTTKDIAKLAINNSRIIIVSDIDEAVKLSNKIAPEHLEIQVSDSEKVVKGVRNYGSLFIGEYSAEVFGDYCSGTNHTLPTNGTARYTGGLSVKDFLKISTYQKILKAGVKNMSETAAALAEIEGLDAHKKAAEIRNKED